jgi:hypothetical protein
MPQPIDRRLDAALAVRDAERLERHLDDAEDAEERRRVDVAHMGDAERLAMQRSDADPENDAAF